MALTQIEPYMTNTSASFTLGGANIGNISNLDVGGGTAGQAVVTDGAGNLAFATTATIGKAVAMAIVFGG